MSSSKDAAHPPAEDGSPHDPSTAVASPATPTPESHPRTSISGLVPGKKTSARLSRSSTAKDAKDGKTVASSPAATRASPQPITPSTTIDPLSQQIFMRTNTDHTVPQRLRSTGPPDSPIADHALLASDLSAKLPASPADASKDKKKGVSFLSRLSMIGSKKRDDDAKDTDSQLSDHRTDGRDAQVFSTALTYGGGFIPHHKEPPRYIRVRANNKKTREFNRMFLAQELAGTRLPPSADAEPAPSGVPVTTTPIVSKKPQLRAGAIWSAKFSLDGKYLAAAGRDQVVRVWAVISTHEERREHEEEEMAAGESDRLSAPVFRNKPVREFRGHKGEVLDLSWSKNNFLLSSSMDKSVRLWHVSRKECLCVFAHKDFVTSIAFHPRDDRFFLAGSLDSVLRLWSIPDNSVAFSAQLPDMITAVAFSPDGKTAIAGGVTGLCHFYDTEGLKLQSHLHVRSSRGKNAKGSKITGIQAMVVPPESEDGDVKVLITSNDSRIRIYNLKDKTMEVKFKGHENTFSQTAASFSDDAHFIICGSEDHRAFVWNTSSVEAENKDKRPNECFDAHSDAVTVAVFAPTKTRQLLGASGDPIYDLCNPPPITLMSLEESASVAGQSEDHASEIIPPVKRPEESPAYIARSTHFDGNIIVTASHTGIIKVFRQDCAWAKRRHESWDTGSLSRKFGSHVSVGRTASILTRTSGSHSRKNSLSTGHGAITPQLSSDRILSWRDGIGENGLGTPTRSERSLSPHKAGSRTPVNAGGANLASEARRAPYAGSPLLHHWDVVPNSPTSSLRSIQSSMVGTAKPRRRNSLLSKRSLASEDPELHPIPTPSFSLTAVADDEPKKHLDPPAPGVTSFWGRWKGISTLTTLRGSGGGSSQTTSSDAAGPSHRYTKGDVVDVTNSPATDDSPRGESSAADAQAEETDETLTLTPETPKMKEKRRKSVGFINVRSRNSVDSPEPLETTSPPTRRQSILRNGRQTLAAGHSHKGGREESATPPPASKEYRPNESRPRNTLPGSSTRLAEVLEKEGREPQDGVLSSPTTVEPRPTEPSATNTTQRDSVATTGSSEGEDMRCSSCGGKEFKVRHVKGTMRQRFLCGKCGTLVYEVGN